MATIVEHARPPAPSQDLSPAVLDIVEHAIRNARHEMDAVLYRTAMSPGIREQHDGFPMLAERDGRMIAGQFGSFIHAFLGSFDGEIAEGDVFLTSDPYSCAGAISHANDWLVIIPIFRDGSLLAWSAMFGHMTDVGGKVPGSLPTDAETIYEEGVVIPPIKLYRRGELDESVLEVILNQVRLPDWNRSDLNALVAACRTGERRILELCDRFGVETYCGAVEQLLQRNYEAMEQLLRRTIPETPVEFSDFVDDDGRGAGPYRLSCRLWRDDDRVVLDWSNTDPQAAGPINFYVNENMLKMFFGVYLIMAVDPQILFNDGYYPLIEVRIPEGTLLKPDAPAALSCRTHALGRVFDVLGGLLGQCQPDFLCGAGFSSSPHLMYSGTKSSGEWFQLYQIGFGGVPGRPKGDGPDAHSMWPSFTNVPNEFLEAYYPLRIEKFECVPDTGGAGTHRGGNGLCVSYRFLEAGNISLHDDRWLTHPWGVKGGEPGVRSSKVLESPDGRSKALPSKADNIWVEVGDVLHYVTWGGGGWGDPLDRDPGLVARDVRRGLATTVGAKSYGVVMDVSGQVEQLATEKLRQQLRTARTGAPELFNRGGEVDALRARSLAETGLPAPHPPGSLDSGVRPATITAVANGREADVEGGRRQGPSVAPPSDVGPAKAPTVGPAVENASTAPGLGQETRSQKGNPPAILRRGSPDHRNRDPLEEAIRGLIRSLSRENHDG